jgi:maltose O-acetyltransferase
MKRFWWSFRAESKSLVLWFLLGMPLTLGVWVRARLLRYFLLKLGTNTVVQQGLRMTNPEKISIGSNCNFGQGAFLTGGGGIRIGDWVGLGPDAKIWSVNHRFDNPDVPWMCQDWERNEVVIEDDVWLGANVFVMPGVRIGKGAIVSAGSIVSKSVPPFAIVVGNPGRVVGWRKRPEPEEAPQPEVAAR